MVWSRNDPGSGEEVEVASEDGAAGAGQRDTTGHMRIDTSFVLLAMLLHLFGTSPPQVADQPLSLSISASEQTVKVGSELKIRATLTNVTSHLITLRDRIPACDYPVEVRDSDGRLATETDYKRHLKCNASFTESRKVLVILKPQESRQEEILITRLFELNNPGIYSVQVSRTIPKDLGEGPIKSNTLTITVTK